MKRHMTLLAMCLLVALAGFAANKNDKKDAKMDKGTTVTGWVTDPACAKSHDVAKMSDSACAKKCAADGKYVIVTDGVTDSPSSVVIDEAENRLHVQKAILAQLLEGNSHR